MLTRLTALVISTAGLAACEDRAGPDYQRCLGFAQRGEYQLAAAACEAASARDAESELGRAAAVKLHDLHVAITRAREAEEAAQLADEEVRATQAERLRDRVQPSFRARRPDVECLATGLPPYRWLYDGGTFRENSEVASYDACQKLTYPEFCCPHAPPDPTSRMRSSISDLSAPSAWPDWT